MVEFKDVLKPISVRRWDVISDRWLDYIPSGEMAPSSRSEEFLDDIVFLDALEKIKTTSGKDFVEFELPSLRTSLFRSGVFYLAKGLNLVSVLENLIVAGYPTASVPTSYIGMTFLTRSFLAFMGVDYFEYKAKSYLVDVWPMLGQTTSQGRSLDWEPFLRTSYVGKRFSHEMHWDLFLYVYRRTRGSNWDSEIDDLFRKMKNHQDFSNRRNRFFYRDEWKYEDLFDYLKDENIGKIENLSVLKKTDVDFDAKIAQVMATLCLHIFLEVSGKTEKLFDTEAVLSQSVRVARQPRSWANGLLPINGWPIS